MWKWPCHNIQAVYKKCVWILQCSLSLISHHWAVWQNWSYSIYSPKIILSSTYTNYKSALSKFSLQTLSERRQSHMQRFALKCISDTFNTNMFPLNTNRHSEKFYVNFARTSQYLHSSIPQCQRLLNTLSNQERNKVDHLL